MYIAPPFSAEPNWNLETVMLVSFPSMYIAPPFLVAAVVLVVIL